MISAQKEADIIRLAKAEEWPIGTIASQLGVHHGVVRRVLGREGMLEARLQRPSIADPYAGFIKETLDKYPKLHASRLFQMVKQRGYPGGPDHFRCIVARFRPRPAAEAYMRLRTLPGEQAQVDWAHFGKLEVDGGQRKLYVFLMVLSFSRKVFARFYLSSAMAAFLRGHVEAYKYFGGVARVNLYDNLKSAVTERVDDAIRFHPTHLQLASHYRFEPRPCNVARGNEKGRVERAVRYLRSSFFAARKFRDVDDLNQQLEEWLVEVSDQRKCPQDTSRTVDEVFAEEQPRLLTLPNDVFPADEYQQVSVRKTPYVRFDRNDYSVPYTYVRKTLVVCASMQTVRLLDGDKCVASHGRCWGVHKQVEDPTHIQELLDFKRRARQARGTDQLHHACTASQAFLRKVAERGGNLGSTVANLLKQLDSWGAEALNEAVQQAVDNDTPHLHAVRQLLDQYRHKRNALPPVSVAISDDPRVTGQRVFTRKLSTYDDHVTTAENDDE